MTCITFPEICYRRVSRHDLRVVSQCPHATVFVTGALGGFRWDMNRDIMDVACVGGNGEI